MSDINLQNRIEAAIRTTNRCIEKSNTEIDQQIAFFEKELAKLKFIKKEREENFFKYLRLVLNVINDLDPVIE